MDNKSTISDLRAAISRLEAEKRSIDEQLQALTTTLLYFERVKQGGGPPSPTSPVPTHSRSERSGRSQYQGADKSPRNVIAEILTAEGPLHRREIYDRLVRMGVQIGGQRPINNVSAHLSLDARFESVGNGKWRLSEPREEAAIDADADQNDSDEEEEDVPW